MYVFTYAINRFLISYNGQAQSSLVYSGLMEEVTRAGFVYQHKYLGVDLERCMAALRVRFKSQFFPRNKILHFPACSGLKIICANV